MLRTIVTGNALFLSLLLAATALNAQAPVERARLPLLQASQDEFSTAAADGKDLFLQLPTYIRPETGSVVRLTLHRLSDPSGTSNAIAIAWNGHLVATNLSDPSATAVTLSASIPRPALARGWNRLALRRVSLSPDEPLAPETEPQRWRLRREECYLDLSYARAPLTDALARFPRSFAEEQIFRQTPDSPPTPVPAQITFLLPGLCSEVHLRAAAIVAARLGQLEELSVAHCRVAALESWKTETAQRHGILIARRDQLGGVNMPLAVMTGLSALMPGQGMLAEFFEGPPLHQQRVLLISGADERGLEKAALTLGSAPALAALTSPAVVDQVPALPAIPPETNAGVRLERPEGLYQLQEFLRTDPWARHAAFALPARLSLEQVRELLPLWWELGRLSPDAPVLWPEVVTYRPGVPPEAARLRGRNVLGLGVVSQWPDLLPVGAESTALRMISPEAQKIIMQGRHHKRSEFEASLTFVQMLPSPWSSSNVVVLLGGWRSFLLPGAQKLLLEPALAGQLGGTLGAIDEHGRLTSYDLRQVSSESFAERLHRTLPPGVGREETEREVIRQNIRQSGAQQWNGRLSFICGGVLILLVGARLFLMWQQTRVRQQALEDNSSP